MSLILTSRPPDGDPALQEGPPLLSSGQIMRAVALFLVLAIAFVVLFLSGGVQAAPAGDGGFDRFVRSLWPAAQAHGVSRATFEAAFRGVTPDPAVIEKTHRQPEFSQTIAQYLSNAVSSSRIENGQSKARAFKTVLERVDAHYGVDPYVVLGVWGMETNFGGHTGNMSTIRSLATLAYAHYRGDYFRKELIAALVVLQGGHVAPADMQGSWAGAMGQTQFMPSSFKTYAVDFDGDGRKDIWKSVPDALGSTANYLRRHGWIAAETWGYEVVLPAGTKIAVTGAQRPFATWAADGVTRADGGPMPSRGSASLLVPAGSDGPVFLVTHNFKVIKSYNNSTSYALGVALLSDRIAGFGPLKAAWPVAAR